MTYRKVARCFKTIDEFLHVLKKSAIWYSIYRDRQVTETDKRKLNFAFNRILDNIASNEHVLDNILDHSLKQGSGRFKK